jgi:hypothetical protein
MHTAAANSEINESIRPEVVRKHKAALAAAQIIERIMHNPFIRGWSDEGNEELHQLIRDLRARV